MVLIAVVGAVAVILLWLVLFFFPQGTKISNLNAQEQQLQTKVDEGNAHVAALKKEALNTPALLQMSKQLSAYVPSTPDIFNYVTTISNTAKAAGVTITNLTPAQPVVAPTSSISTISVSVQVTGTYDQILTFVKDVYGLPRLTSILNIDITGGATGTRATALTAALTLTIYTSSKPVPGPS